MKSLFITLSNFLGKYGLSDSCIWPHNPLSTLSICVSQTGNNTFANVIFNMRNYSMSASRTTEMVVEEFNMASNIEE